MDSTFDKYRARRFIDFFSKNNTFVKEIPDANNEH